MKTGTYETLHGHVNGLRDIGRIRSMPFRLDAMGRLDYTGVPAELLTFKRGFERWLWGHELPFFACAIDHEGVRFIHWELGNQLTPEQWKFLAEVGREVCVREGVHVFQSGYDPSWWYLEGL